MLNILADALLIATLQSPPHGYAGEKPDCRPDARHDARQRRRWLSFAGLLG